MVSPRDEWEFVLHTANLYERMGCDLLALDLVRTWEFLKPPPPAFRLSRTPLLSPAITTPLSPFHPASPPSTLAALDYDPRKLLRRRSSLVVADLPPGDRERVKDMLAGYGVEEGSNENSDEEVEEQNKKVEEKPKPKPQPTQFREPDANSLLDAFGF